MPTYRHCRSCKAKVVRHQSAGMTLYIRQQQSCALFFLEPTYQ